MILLHHTIAPSPIWNNLSWVWFSVILSLYFFVSVSCMFRSAIISLISVCVLRICGLLVFGFVDLFFSVDLFFQICGICCKFGLWFLSFGRSRIWRLSTRAWFDSNRDFSQSVAGPPFRLSPNPNRPNLWTPLATRHLKACCYMAP